MISSDTYYVGLINNQYSRDQSQFGPGYVKHLDEPVGVRGSQKYLDIDYFNFLFCVDLNNPEHCDRFKKGLPAAIDGLKAAIQFQQEELDSYDNSEIRFLHGVSQRPNFVCRIEVISILFDRFQKIQQALNTGSPLHEACKAYKLFENKSSIYFNKFEYENRELFVQSQLELNKPIKKSAE